MVVPLSFWQTSFNHSPQRNTTNMGINPVRDHIPKLEWNATDLAMRATVNMDSCFSVADWNTALSGTLFLPRYIDNAVAGYNTFVAFFVKMVCGLTNIWQRRLAVLPNPAAPGRKNTRCIIHVDKWPQFSSDEFVKGLSLLVPEFACKKLKICLPCWDHLTLLTLAWFGQSGRF